MEFIGLLLIWLSGVSCGVPLGRRWMRAQLSTETNRIMRDIARGIRKWEERQMAARLIADHQKEAS